jgi:membrane protease YdiL (CAAX protease family)
MTLELIPYLLLLVAIIIGWRLDARISIAFLAAAIIAGLVLDRLAPIALIWIAILGLSIWIPTKLQHKGLWRIFFLGVFLILSVAMSNHFAPGFHNFPIFQSVQFSPDSIPFTMYLNFDKTLVGFFIYLFFLRGHQRLVFTKTHLLISAKTLAILLVLIVPFAFVIRYIRIDPKLPQLGWIWILNNIFFVCLAEESLFRGFIQKELSNIFPKQKIWTVTAIAITAVLFGLAHYKGGFAYIALATIAGGFYGYAYQRTNRIESAILVHFGLNAIHFLFFSYPALAS